MKLKIAGLIAALALLVPRSFPLDSEASPVTASQFAELVERLSEDSGYFWNDNYVSNEASYLHPLGKLEQLGVRGGIYLGVGPNQNFTYIAKLKPRYAFIIDIRRQNLLEHLMFKALFHYSRDRRDYLSMLLSRPLRSDATLRDKCTIDEIVRFFEKVEPDFSLYHKTQRRIRMFLSQACRLRLTDQDFTIIAKIHAAFFTRGLSIKYDYIPVPTYGEFLREKDLDGKQQNFMNSSQDFRYLKQLQEENRIIPLVGDFAGTHTLREIGKLLRERNEKVTLFYTSNVEQYLMRSESWSKFLENVQELPLDDCAVFIRAYWSNRQPHPEGVEGYAFTQILQWSKPFLKRFSQKPPTTYWEIVTTDIIKLK